MTHTVVIWPMVIPDEKYQNSPTGGKRSPTGGFSPLCPPCSAAPAPQCLNPALRVPSQHCIETIRCLVTNGTGCRDEISSKVCTVRSDFKQNVGTRIQTILRIVLLFVLIVLQNFQVDRASALVSAEDREASGNSVGK